MSFSLSGDPVNKPSISCFFPCYNDRGTIATMVLSALFTLKEVSDDYEVIVVDDGSEDGARQLLKGMKGLFPEHLRLVFHDQNRGYGGALISGFEAATKDWVFYTDGDAQYDPAQLKLLVEAMDDDIDLVQGYKTKRNDPTHRKLIGGTYQHLIRFAFSLKVWDVDCDFRLIRRKTMESFTLTRRSGAICVELMKKLQMAGARFTEVGVRHHFRVYGQSQIFNVPRLVRSLWQLGGLWIELVGMPALKSLRAKP